jgi:histidinol-phosphate phosphatase family protein
MTALFLDRDGVINEEKDGSYIFHKNEFVFYPGAVDALVNLSRKFDYVFIVTNQRGVGRGYMTEAALLEIHDHLTEQVVAAGGHITRIYFAPSIDSDHSHRKPNTGMALDAQKDFPDIEFGKSVMVGNNLSDMQFGKSMGMKTVFLYTTQSEISLPHKLIDEQYDSLQSWSLQMAEG